MSRSFRHPFALLAPAIVLVLSVACGDPAGVAPVETPTPTPVSHEVAVRAIAVTPAALALHPGWLDSITVVVTDSAGNALTGRTVTFAIDDPYVATVRGDGVVTGAAAGSTTLRVTSEGVTVRVPVVVTPATAHAIALTPQDTTLTEGQTRLWVVSLRDERGIAINDRPVTWSSSDASVAAVTPIGGYSPAATVGAVRVGEATITASAGGLRASATLRVRPRVARVVLDPPSLTLHIGDEVQLTGTAYDAAGNVLADRALMYVSSGGVAPVTSTGRVRAMFDGTSRIIAWAEGVADTTQVTVLRPVYFVDVSPRMVTMSVGTTLPLSVTLRDVAGRPLEGRTILFASENPGVATVDGTGTVKAVGRGVTMIRVTSEGRSGQAQVTVP
jgi:uncharacterized protein YjdB